MIYHVSEIENQRAAIDPGALILFLLDLFHLELCTDPLNEAY